MGFGNVRGLGAWGVALAASLALHLVVIAVIAVSGMMGGANGGGTPPPRGPQTDGRAQDLPLKQSTSSASDDSDSPALSGKSDRPQPGAKGKQQEEIGRSTKSERSKPGSRKVSTAKEDKAGTVEPVKDGWKPYKVKPGDSLTKIARVCGCSVAELAKANGLSVTASLKLGQTIKVKNMPTDAE